MRSLFSFFLIQFFIYSGFCQINTEHDKRIITVTGSAETEIQPDEIELEIILKEYGKTDKSDLDKIEKRFFEVLAENNILKEKVTFNGNGFYWYYWWSWRNDFHRQKRFNIKLSSSTDFLKLVKGLDFKGVSSLRIAGTTNEKIREYRKEVKIAATKAAKEKAEYMLESIDEKLGKVISIEELPDSRNHYWRGNQNLVSNASVSTHNTGNEIDNVAVIRLRYEVKAKFEIRE